jgi:hypothetical protein
MSRAEEFIVSPNVRAILGQISPKFDLAFAMDNRRILIANLSKGVIGEQAANLFGSLLVSVTPKPFATIWTNVWRDVPWKATW